MENMPLNLVIVIVGIGIIVMLTAIGITVDVKLERIASILEKKEDKHGR